MCLIFSTGSYILTGGCFPTTNVSEYSVVPFTEILTKHLK